MEKSTDKRENSCGKRDEGPRLYMITVYSENQIGLLSIVANVFTRRSVNIESMAAFPSGHPGIHRMKIMARTTEAQASFICKQIEKKVEVIKAFYYLDPDARAHEKPFMQEFLKLGDEFGPDGDPTSYQRM